MIQDLADKLLSWLVDMLLHCRDVDGLLRVQEPFLNECAACGVKLGAAKMDHCSQEVRRCGRMVSKDGVWLKPSSVSAPTPMQPTVTGATCSSLCALSCPQLRPSNEHAGGATRRRLQTRRRPNGEAGRQREDFET
jgi:hypothetical protein